MEHKGCAAAWKHTRGCGRTRARCLLPAGNSAGKGEFIPFILRPSGCCVMWHHQPCAGDPSPLGSEPLEGVGEVLGSWEGHPELPLWGCGDGSSQKLHRELPWDVLVWSEAFPAQHLSSSRNGPAGAALWDRRMLLSLGMEQGWEWQCAPPGAQLGTGDKWEKIPWSVGAGCEPGRSRAGAAAASLIHPRVLQGVPMKHLSQKIPAQLSRAGMDSQELSLRPQLVLALFCFWMQIFPRLAWGSSV